MKKYAILIIVLVGVLLAALAAPAQAGSSLPQAVTPQPGGLTQGPQPAGQVTATAQGCQVSAGCGVEPPPATGLSVPVIAGIAAAVLLVGAGAGWWFVSRRKVEEEEDDGEEETPAEAEK